jgi:nucleoside-diphosphate-sugar epimerase
MAMTRQEACYAQFRRYCAGAWHGIHEDRGEKDAYDFVDLNVRGTFEVFEAAASAGIGKVV